MMNADAFYFNEDKHKWQYKAQVRCEANFEEKKIIGYNNCYFFVVDVL